MMHDLHWKTEKKYCHYYCYYNIIITKARIIVTLSRKNVAGALYSRRNVTQTRRVRRQNVRTVVGVQRAEVTQSSSGEEPVFSSLLKDTSDVAALTDAVSPFHALDAATGNERSPSVERDNQKVCAL